MKLIRDELFNHDIFVMYRPTIKIVEIWCKKRKHKVDVDDLMKAHGFSIRGESEHLIVINKLNSITHECAHVARHILQDCMEIPPCEQTDEVYCYYLEWLIDKVKNAI